MGTIGTDIGRAAAGGVTGAAVAVGLVSIAPSMPWWLAVPGSIIAVGLGAVLGAGVSLTIGDWRDRR